jgi:hypothetical protein
VGDVRIWDRFVTGPLPNVGKAPEDSGLVNSSAAVSEALDTVGRESAAEHGCDPGLLRGYLPALLGTAATLRRLSEQEKEDCRGRGARRRRRGWRCPRWSTST